MTYIQIPSLDGKNFDAYIARPSLSTAPVIIVIQEVFGVNAAMRNICDALAQDGYLALCPDLFWRQERNVQLTDKTDAEWRIADQLYDGFNVELGISDLIATLAYARKMPGCNGTIGTVGHCLGGRLAFLLAARSDLDCTVSYYGVGLENYLSEMADVRHPLLMHVAGQDKFVPPEAQEKILRAAARNSAIRVELYKSAPHAFARPDGVHYDPVAAALANERTAAFLAAHLRR
ncbi:MAG: dienelactone hydrolase family protein [Alphaproteobacteria bacterium]